MEHPTTCDRCGHAVRSQPLAVAWSLTIAVALLALVASFWLGGELLRNFLEGMQRTTLPFWKGLVPIVLVAIAWACWSVRFSRAACSACVPVRFPLREVGLDAHAEAVAGLGRRTVLRQALAGAVGFCAAGFAALVANRDWLEVFGRVILAPAPIRAETRAPHWRGARVRSLRRLGRTELHVSDISFGCGQLRDAAVARRAIDQGINYFDTSPDYSYLGSEEALGAAIRGRRDQVVVATKFCAANGHLRSETSVPDIMRSVEGSLQRLGTDFVDLIHIHSCDRLDRLLAPNIHEAFDRLKQDGKVRFLGVSSHAPNLEQVANAAIDSGRFDVMMLAYHFGMWPKFDHILARANAADVGIVAMKTLKGAREARLARMDEEMRSYPQAAFRWVLSNPNVSCLVVSIVDEAQIDEYLYASGETPRHADQALLEHYDASVAGDYCQPHCGACRNVCPVNLPVDDILRARMYQLDYGWSEEATRVLSPLQRRAQACYGCPAPCATVCPQGIAIPAMVFDTFRQTQAS